MKKKNTRNIMNTNLNEIMECLKKYKKILSSPGTEQWWYFVKLEDTRGTNLKAEDVFAEIYAGISEESNVNAQILYQSVIKASIFVFLTFLDKETIILLFKTKIENIITKGFTRDLEVSLCDESRTVKLSMFPVIPDGFTIYDKLNKVISDEVENPSELLQVRIKYIEKLNSGKRH